MKNPIIFIISVLALAACVHQPEWTPDSNFPVNDDPCDPNTVYFQNDILPILLSNCAMPGCHDANTRAEGIQLTDYAAMMNSRVIQAGNLNKSELWEVITDNDPGDRMPLGRPALSNDQLTLIRKWIEQGAQNNQCDKGCDTTKFTYSAVIAPLLKQNCTGCHSSASPSAGVVLDNHPAVQTLALNGRLFGAVNHEAGYKAMPLGGQKMELCKVTQIRKWIDGGALNN